MKVLVIASLAYSLVNFRGALLRRMVEEGHEVVACAPDEDTATIAELARSGVRFRVVPMDRIGINPIRDCDTLAALVRVIRAEAPDVILAYTQKPIVYGGIAARLARPRARFFAMVSGLGHVYSEDAARSYKLRLVRGVLSRLYRLAVARAAGIFVFNADDGEELRRHGIVASRQRVSQVPGSGIDTNAFAFSPVTDGPPVFLLIARLMRNKGIAEFVRSAADVRQRYPSVRFQVLGQREDGAAGFSEQEIAGWRASGVEYLGTTRDVRPFLQAASVFVLPTYYREGLPRTILEAMAIGRAIITTDTPGCRETVQPGRNGLLVRPRDTAALTRAIEKLAADADRVAAMGAQSRKLAVERFRVEVVNAKLLGEMGLVGTSSVPHPPHSHRALGDRRVAEPALAILAIMVLAPVMALTGVAVAVWLGRPVLFRQRRSGLDGQPFGLVKFRSMADRCDARGHVLPDAERLTRFGQWLRRSRLDELPELLNIVRGEMSFVGPRPLLPETLVAMGPAARRRGAVRPGLTGWAQVNGNALLDDADKLALDLWYVEHRSLALDAKIALRTFAVVARGERINQHQVGRAHARLVDRRG